MRDLYKLLIAIVLFYLGFLLGKIDDNFFILLAVPAVFSLAAFIFANTMGRD